jgi:hypothetical protein
LESVKACREAIVFVLEVFDVLEAQVTADK